ncbi:retroviral aspartyl protease family protein [Trichonephila clavipes]|nr:retroviral aspartyl protease family protein [Trichonephila clavipes]
MTESPSWQVYKTQFSHSGGCKPVGLPDQGLPVAASLRADAADILQTLPETQRLYFDALVNVLELRFRREMCEGLQQTPAEVGQQKVSKRSKNWRRTSRGFLAWRFLTVQLNKQHEKDRHPIRAVNESDTSNSGVERLERQMRSFMNRVESLMSQKADGKKTLKCWTLRSRRASGREAAGHAKALKLMRLPEGGVGKPPMAISWGGGCQILEKAPLSSVSNFDKEYRKAHAERLFQEFEDVFSRNSSDIGHTAVTQHRIDTADHPPIKQHPRRLPFAKQEEVGTLREMRENDIIEPSSSPWASQSSWFVRKMTHKILRGLSKTLTTSPREGQLPSSKDR